MSQILTVSTGSPPHGAAEGRAVGVQRRGWDWTSVIGPIGLTAAGRRGAGAVMIGPIGVTDARQDAAEQERM
jgi:hypothetical protein